MDLSGGVCGEFKNQTIATLKKSNALIMNNLDNFIGNVVYVFMLCRLRVHQGHDPVSIFTRVLLWPIRKLGSDTGGVRLGPSLSQERKW